MTAVAQLNGSISRIEAPTELRNLRGWLVWRLELKPGRTKHDKVPYYADGRPRGGHGTEEDRRSLVTFEAAKAFAARKNYDGVGFATLPDWGIVALDFDDLVTSDLRAQVEQLVDFTYAEWSPSGEGIHAFVRCRLPNKKSRAGDRWPFGFETFGESGYVTFTGNRLENVDLLGHADTIAPISDDLMALYAERFGQVKPREERRAPDTGRTPLPEEELRKLLTAFDPSCSYDEWIRIGMALHHETDGEGLELWDQWSSTGSNYEGYDVCRQHWDSFGKKTLGNPITIASLIKAAAARGVSVGWGAAAPEAFPDETTPEERAAAEKAKAERLARFAVVPFADFANRPAPGWVIKGVLPQADLVVAYGPSTAGKSFVLIDMGMAIARGVPWRGKKVRQGRVVYICAEGAGGFRNRLKAYAIANEIDPKGVPFGVINAAPNFLLKKDVDDVREAINAAEGAEVIIVDTLAQVTPGANENAAEDMGEAIANARAVGAATGAMVILVHHMGKDTTKGGRGWSGIKAAADAEFEIMRDEVADKRWIETTKQKDGPDNGRWGFRLQEVRIGEDEDGDPITSCVIADADPPVVERKSRVRSWGEWEKAVMDAMALLEMTPEPITMPLIIEAAVSARTNVEGPLWRQRGNARKAIEGLIKKGDLWKIGELIATREK